MPLRAPCRIGVIIFLPCSMRYTTHTHTHRSCSKTARDEKTSFDSRTNPLSETPFSFLRPNHINQYNHPHMHSHTRPSAHPSIHPSIGVSVADLSTVHRTLCPASTIKHTTTYYRTIQNETEQQHERKRDTNIGERERESKTAIRGLGASLSTNSVRLPQQASTFIHSSIHQSNH